MLGEALDSFTIPVAVIEAHGRLRTANRSFQTAMAERAVDSPARLRLLDRAADDLLAHTIAAAAHTDQSARTLALPAIGAAPPATLHILPIRGHAHDLVGTPGFLLTIAGACNSSLPHADLLRLLFDLTPREAEIARLLADGRPVAEVAARLGNTTATVRTHVKAIFAKLGVSRQVELVLLLRAYTAAH